jgi:hypothetical protein
VAVSGGGWGEDKVFAGFDMKLEVQTSVWCVMVEDMCFIFTRSALGYRVDQKSEKQALNMIPNPIANHCFARYPSPYMLVPNTTHRCSLPRVPLAPNTLHRPVR